MLNLISSICNQITETRAAGAAMVTIGAGVIGQAQQAPSTATSATVWVGLAVGVLAGLSQLQKMIYRELERRRRIRTEQREQRDP